MGNLSKQRPPRDVKQALRTPSLERYFPSADAELGIAASDISDTAKQRHYARYAAMVQLIRGHVGKNNLVADIGSGSGYGSFMLSQHFRRVVGVEPDDFARRYAAKHYPEVLFVNDLGDLVADVAVMVEVIEHLSEAECALYLKGTKTLAVTTPIVEHPDNAYHVHAFRKAEDLHAYVASWGFMPTAIKVHTGITFTTGEQGNNIYAVYARR